jgi:hypothetical protein
MVRMAVDEDVVTLLGEAGVRIGKDGLAKLLGAEAFPTDATRGRRYPMRQKSHKGSLGIN